jgi:hypothetical protein
MSMQWALWLALWLAAIWCLWLAALSFKKPLGETVLFWIFPYVYPEPVLAKMFGFYMQMRKKTDIAAHSNVFTHPLLSRVVRGAFLHHHLLTLGTAPATASPCDRAIRPRARVLGEELALRRVTPLEIEACGKKKREKQHCFFSYDKRLRFANTGSRLGRNAYSTKY